MSSDTGGCRTSLHAAARDVGADPQCSPAVWRRAKLFEYDERGNLTKRTDALGHVTQWTYDALDRRVQETNAIDGVTALVYDAAGNVTSVTDPEQSTTTYGYDGLSRLVSVTQPLGQTVRYEWDARDRLAKKILARSSMGGSSEHPEIRYTYETWGPLVTCPPKTGLRRMAVLLSDGPLPVSGQPSG